MRWTDDLLDQLRREGDPPADGAIAQVVADGQVQHVNALLRQLLENDQPVPEQLPPSIREYLKETARLPAWVDPARLRRAARFGAARGMLVATVLSTGSLVNCYAYVKGVKVLAFSHRLDQDAIRRVAETAQFVLYLLSEEAFTERGRAIPAIQKVRLMHGAIRHLVGRSARWDAALLGEPINQEDLLGTLMEFSVTVLRGMARLGMPADPLDARDYYELWRVTGEMMGIRPDLIPETLAAAEALTERIHRRHLGPSPEGVRMTQALLAMQQTLLPGRLFDGAMPALVRMMVGDRVADWLEVPRTGWEAATDSLPLIGRALSGAEARSALVRRAVGEASRTLLMTDAVVIGGFRRARFEIPEDLGAAWGGGG